MASFDFQSHRNDVARKAEAARREVANLFRDGKPRYTPQDHQEQMGRVLAPLRQAVTEAVGHSQKAQEEAKKLEALQHSDPLASLTTDELVRLNAARELAKDEITALLPAELGARIEAVAASGDKVSQLLHLLYAKPVVQASNDSALHAQLGAIDEAVNGKQRVAAAKALGEAQALRKGAGELSFFASNTLGEIDGSNQASLQQRRDQYAAAF